MRIHFIGKSGASMKRLAEICTLSGHEVTGSDIALKGHNPQNVKGVELVVYTAAVGEDNCEVIEARSLGIPIVERAAFLGTIAEHYTHTIAVSGSHGKTTTTSMLAKIFENQPSTVHIGADYPQQSKGKTYFITEACEYKRSFLSLKPALALVLNIELDHTDYYKDYKDYFSAFSAFCKQSNDALLFGDNDKIFKWAMLNGYTTFGFCAQNHYSAQNIQVTPYATHFDFYIQKTLLGRIKISLFGEYNVLNALAAASSSHKVGISVKEIIDGLGAFGGVSRRFESLGVVNGTQIVSDYAHHPTELTAMLQGAKSRGYKDISIVFEPHTYTRTASLYKDFAASLNVADTVYIMPVYSAREEYRGEGAGYIITDAMQAKHPNSYYIESYDTLFAKLNNQLSTPKPNRVIVFAGAGSIDAKAREWANSIISTT